MSARSVNDETIGNLRTGLIEARSVREFFLRHRGQIDWRTIASFKSEIDRLVCCDLRRAVVLAGRIAQLSALVGDPLSEAFSMASNARVLDHRGRHSMANLLYERAASALHTARLSKEAAIIHKEQLHALIQLGRYQDALRIARAARRVLARGEPVQLGQLEANIGNIYYRLDRYTIALAHYDKAREILSKSGDPSMLALIDFSRSNIFAETDRPDEALALLNRAAGQFQHAGRLLQSWQARFRIAYLKFLRGNYNGALASYFEALDRLTEMGSTELVGYCHLEMAEVLLALNAFQDAAENAKSAEAIFKQLQMPFESARTSLLQGLAAMGSGDYDPCHTHLAAAREVFAESRNTVFTALTDLYLAELAGRQDDYAEVMARAGSSLRAFTRSGLPTKTAYARLLMARADFKLGDWSKAARTIQRALGDVDGVFAPVVVYSCHHLLGRVERARKQPDAALNHFRRAVHAVEQMRGGIGVDEFKSSFLHDKTEVYEDAIAACLEGGTRPLLKEAFQLVESLKSRALADLLARYVRGVAADDPEYQGRDIKSQGRARLVGLIEDLNWHSSQAGLQEESGGKQSSIKASRYRNIVVKQERKIVQSFRRMEAEDHSFSEIQHMRPATEAALRRAIEPDELVVEYFMTGDNVSAFIVSREEIRVVKSIVSKQRLDPMLSALRFQMDKFKYAAHYLGGHLEQMKKSADERLGGLYDAVFAPLERLIDRRRVIIIPHGPLHYIPFCALHDGSGYLVDRLELTYAPSAAVLKLCRERSVLSRQMWSSAESDETGGRLVALGVDDPMAPNIGEEIATLKAIFPDTVDLTGDQATRENLFRFAPDARFLHLASHGCFQRDNPMFSYLRLADCRLSFYNLLDLTLKSEIVTLSACQTGVNAILPGDELHGLMRGFLYAGAPSLVVSLWTVSDQSTAAMMREMYMRIRAGCSKRSSLREAQLAIKQQYEHPYYWAPFVLMGSPD